MRGNSMLTTYLSLLVTLGLVSVYIKADLHYEICGDGHCLCQRQTANCSGKGLSYIPKIHSNVRNLDLSVNVFTSLSDMSFENISAWNINILNVSFCQIQHLAPNTFKNFTALKTLVMTNNPVDFNDFTAVMTVTKFHFLSTFHINNLNLSSLSFFRNMTSPHLKNLNIDHNILTVYDHSVFINNRRLTRVSAKGNAISSLIYAQTYALQELFLDTNHITTIPNFCTRRSSYFPKLKRLFLDYNYLSDIGDLFVCLPNLETLSLCGNPINIIKTNTFSKLPNLIRLVLRSLHNEPPINSYAFNNSNLHSLALTNSHIEFSTDVDVDAFKGLPKMYSLELSANKFRKVTEDKMIKIFGHLRNVNRIGMGLCQLGQIPDFISMLDSLTGVSLYQNLITKLPDNVFSKNLHLKRVWLDQNKISVIRKSTFSPFIRKGFKLLNLANNPFDCDCSLQWFIEWTKQEGHIFQQFPNKYICNSPGERKRLLLKDIEFSLNSCFLPFTVVTTVVGTSTVLIFIVSLASVLYKFRWRIRHYIYMNYYRPRQKRIQEDPQEYKYDAYIIHSEKDEDWVVDEMIPCLEDINHMKLCVPGRDFLPGSYILNNIDEAIQTSRHIIVVLSHSFVQSEWCQAELSMAQSFVLDTRGNELLAIVIEEPDASNMRHSLYVLLRSTAYIIWGEEEEAKQLFWRRLVESMRHDGLDQGN